MPASNVTLLVPEPEAEALARSLAEAGLEPTREDGACRVALTVSSEDPSADASLDQLIEPFGAALVGGGGGLQGGMAARGRQRPQGPEG